MLWSAVALNSERIDGDDHDGDVDFTDFNDLANNYTGSLDGGKAVPEPSGLALLAMGAVSLAACALRRRKWAA